MKASPKYCKMILFEELIWLSRSIGSIISVGYTGLYLRNHILDLKRFYVLNWLLIVYFIHSLPCESTGTYCCHTPSQLSHFEISKISHVNSWHENLDMISSKENYFLLIYIYENVSQIVDDDYSPNTSLI